jgi:hypothetical protein
MGFRLILLHAVMRACVTCCRHFDNLLQSEVIAGRGVNPYRVAAILWRFFQNGQGVQEFASTQ